MVICARVRKGHWIFPPVALASAGDKGLASQSVSSLMSDHVSVLLVSFSLSNNVSEIFRAKKIDLLAIKTLNLIYERINCVHKKRLALF